MASIQNIKDPSLMVILKDGSVVSEKQLITTTKTLYKAQEESFVAIYDLVEKCKNPNHQLTITPFCNSKKILTRLGLIDGEERVFDIVKNAVKNCTEGKGIDIKLKNPEYTRA
ncbi:MAG: hypothetical protein JHC93_08655 [Parachlamydiales bacterium]|nr:hypothetical protein [Parachlamydiales bacterium]